MDCERCDHGWVMDPNEGGHDVPCYLCWGPRVRRLHSARPRVQEPDVSELSERTIPRYGWKPSLPDARDHVADASGIKVLPEVDPRPDMPPVFDQGQLGSCTANAVAGAIEYDAKLNGHDFGAPSRLFIYYGERQLEGSLGQGDTGAFGRDGFKLAHKVGTPPETDWAYDISKFEDKPPDQAYQDAAGHKIGTYRVVPQMAHSMRAVVSNRQTIAFGFTVYESFESPEVAQSGIVPIPDVQNEKVLGGHEVLMVGYLKDYPHHFLCRNSWSENWGIGGYFLMPIQVMLSRDMASDFRTIARAVGK